MGRNLLALLLLGSLVACKGTPAPPPVDNPTEPEAPAFRVDVSQPPACTRGTPCEAKVVLTALDGFKVNAEYPFKFVADANPALAYEAAFAHDSTKTGTLTIKFTASEAGTAKVSGTFKLSVCTDEVCKIEAPKIAFDVPVN